jgi:hypothetical protein
VEAQLQESELGKSKEDDGTAQARFVGELGLVADWYSAWTATSEITYDALARVAGIAPASRAVTIRL